MYHVTSIQSLCCIHHTAFSFNRMFDVDVYNAEEEFFSWTKGGFQGARGENTGGEWFIENVFEELDYPMEVQALSLIHSHTHTHTQTLSLSLSYIYIYYTCVLNLVYGSIHVDICHFFPSVLIFSLLFPCQVFLRQKDRESLLLP